MTTRAPTAIFYPETDGMPLPDGEYQAPIYVRVLSILLAYFKDVPGAWVNGDTFIYYIEGDNRRTVSPDCYVVFGLSEAAQESLSLEGNNTYLLWEVGKSPDFVLEIGSPSTARRDLGAKRDLYAELEVGEYWRFDASGGDFYGEPLVGERLVDGEYVRLEMREESDGRVWAHSDTLGLDLWWEEGELRFWDIGTEGWLPTYEELLARADEEQARADEEQARADEEQTRADEERARADEERAARIEAEARLAALEAELRRLRGE